MITHSDKQSHEYGNIRRIMSHITDMLGTNFTTTSSGQEMLCKVMQQFQASRVYIVEYDWDNLTQDCVLEVLAEGVGPEMAKFKAIPLEDTPWFTQRLCARKPIIVNDIELLPEDATIERRFTLEQGVSSFILLPVVTGETVVGFWGMDTEADNRHVWTEEDYHWCSAFSHILSVFGSFHRDNMQNSIISTRKWELNKSRLNSIYNNIPVGVEIYDKEGYMIDHNDKDVEIFGMTDKEELVGKCLFENPIIPDHLKNRLKNKEDINLHLRYDFALLSGYYQTHLRKSVKTISVKGKCIFNLQGELDYYLFVVSDVTEADRMYTEVQDFQNMFSVIAHYSKVGYAKYNLSTKEGFAAGEWYRNLGEAEGTPLKEIIAVYRHVDENDRKRLQDFYANALQGGERTFSGDVRIVRPDGTYRWLHKNIILEERKNGDLESVEINFDITYNKETEASLVAAREKAEEANRLKSAFLANMSHEIRTPLNAIVGFSNVLVESEDETERQEYVSIIENNNELLLQLVSDILDLSKIEAGTLEFNYSDVDINNILREIEHASKMRLKNDCVELRVEEYMPECVIHTEKNRVTQVLVNFVNNAMKFTSRGSIRIGYKLQEDDMIYFYVSDTGKGIPKEKQKQVFERFTKLDSMAQGTGLGLTICSTIVERLGGAIGVESEEGKGSTFWFTLPYTPVDRKKAPEVTEPLPKEPVRKDRLTLLIAEDNPSNYRLYESILKRDYILLHAWNGEEAVKLYIEHRPHLVLMDIKMPVMNGFEATKKIREISKTVPIIAVTAFAFEADEQRILASGFDDYTTKPVKIKTLRNKILELLNRNMFIL